MDQNQICNDAVIAQAFETIPLLQFYRQQDFKVTSLRGFTNQNYRLVSNEVDWVLRIPKKETNEFINRSDEAFNRAQAANLHLTNETLWSDEYGLSLSPTLVNTKSLSPDLLQQNSLLDQLARHIKKLHSNETAFKGQLDIGETIHRYYDCLDMSKKKTLMSRMKEAEPAMVFFRKQNMLVPTHSDLNENNILIDEHHRLWFIDWEYSAMANPYWDLAIVCHYCRLNDSQMTLFLNYYCDGDGSLVECELVNFTKLIGLLTDCWMAALVN